MSIDEETGAGPGFERTPPSNIEAEQSVLGGMLLSKDAIADVVEIIRSDDFYRPAHQMIYDVITDLYGRGEPADAVTVFDELQKRGEMARVGGAAYLHTLTAVVPTAANAGYYAKIVREQAILRRLIEAGTRIVSFGYGGQNEEVDDLVDRAQAEIYKVTERRTSEDYAPLADIMPGALDELEAIGSRGGQMVGVPTGFQDLDQLTNGLHPGQMIVVAARPAIGKALALDTPLPTPTGWTTMGEVAVGDHLIGADGRPTRVVAATEVMHGRPCYEVEFADGTVVVADGSHQWLTETRASGGSTRQAASVRTTEEIAATLRCDIADRRYNHSVPVTRAADLPERDLPLPPYTLGVWLGGGHRDSARFTTTDPEIVGHMEQDGVRVDKVGPGPLYSFTLPEPPGVAEAILRSLDVLGNKHVPAAYLRAGERQRRELLAGLLDTGGHADPGGTVVLAVTDQRLAHDVHELVLSLGYTATMTTKTVQGRSCHQICFTPADKVFRLSRKLAGQSPTQTHEIGYRHITAVRRIDSVPVRCVEVDNPDHLYLASRAWIPTHNSTLGLDFARSAAIKHGMTTVIFSLEMSRNEITMRLLSAEARVALHAMRSGMMGDDDWTRLARRMSEVAEAPLFIDDSPNMSMMEIRAKCRRLKQRNDLRFVVIDYLQLMSSPKKTESRQNEVSEISRAIKLLAKELEVPVIAISQLNRGPEQRTDKRPAVSDLRESGCLTAATRIMRADTGAEVSLGELLASGARDIPVWSLDERLKLVPRTMTHVFPSGVKRVYRVRLRSGREVEATANHPFLSYDGWRALEELAPGTRVAVPRHVPPPLDITPWDEDELILLARLIGDGSFVERQPIRHGGVDGADPSAVAEWLDGLGLLGLRSHEKFLPAGLFSLPKAQAALFLRHLWATDGRVRWDDPHREARVSYTSASRRLIDDVARLLLRFNVMTRVEEVREGEHRPSYQLLVHGAENQLRFLDEIGIDGARATRAAECVRRLRGVTAGTDLDTVPEDVWTKVRSVLLEKRVSQREYAAAVKTEPGGTGLWKTSPSRERLGRMAAVLGEADLELLATNDIFWDEIASVEDLGEQPVFDATVMGTHNFIANGISLHNSIEQDADMVILLHREDAYERESPRAGEADLIVAKHRNGPTATVTVAFQGHYSRFVDMAQH
ncbi:replicative DNA helicase [Nonomuraea sp. 3-1Str]|uniref:replicative DNA helicase n=1 Tax=Nonomuraea sp. 3-1Str TaxID=2929801 RepID=UPI00287076AF|nr:replicative DNA helicase [Nonomuraea sp. 3-1Str]